MNFRCKMWPLQPAVEPQRSTYTIWIPHAKVSKKERDIVSSCLFMPCFFRAVSVLELQTRMKHKRVLQKSSLQLIKFKIFPSLRCAMQSGSKETIWRNSNKDSKVFQSTSRDPKDPQPATPTQKCDISSLTTLQSCGDRCDAHQVR